MNPPARTRASRLPLIAQIAFCLGALLWIASLLKCPGFQNARLPEILFPLLALAVTLVSLAQNLPLQNVLAAAALIAVATSIVEIIDAKTALPFGQRMYLGNIGPRLLGVLPWPVPIIWVVAILNSRGVARLILRPWRKLSKYGLWVIGLTTVLTVVFDLSLEPFATVVRHYWIWLPGNVPSWHTTPATNFLGWLVVTLLILAFATPWLINKNSSRSSPPDYQPLIIWLVIQTVFVSGTAVNHLWSAAIFTLAVMTTVSVFAIRGARW